MGNPKGNDAHPITGAINNGMSIIGVGIDRRQVVKGLVLPAAVFLDVYYKNKASKHSDMLYVT